MEIQYKTTMWSKIILDEDEVSKEKVIELLEKGFNPNDIPFELNLNHAEYEYMYDTESGVLTINENGGHSTMELMIDGETVWDNEHLKTSTTHH